jgi:hypothetical protein
MVYDMRHRAYSEGRRLHLGVWARAVLKFARSKCTLRLTKDASGREHNLSLFPDTDTDTDTDTDMHV